MNKQTDRELLIDELKILNQRLRQRSITVPIFPVKKFMAVIDAEISKRAKKTKKRA
jgi:hypothetical protein